MLATLFLGLFLAQSIPDAAPRLREAAGLFARGKPAAALPIVDEILSQDARLPEALVLRALLLDALDRSEDAQAAHEAALKVLPNDPKLLRIFGEHWLRRGRRAEAVVFLERSLALAPGDARALRLLADAGKPAGSAAKPVGRGPRRPASAPADAARSTADADPYALVQQANAHLERGEYQRVLDIVDRLLRQHPRSQSSHLLRALALDGLQRPDEARQSYEAALGIAPEDPQILSLYGKHLLKREAWDEAVRRFEQSLAVAPDDVDTLFYLAQARFQTLDKGRGLAAIERCATLAPNNATIQLKLGEYRAHGRKFSPALDALLKAQTLSPDEPGLDLALGIVHLSLLDVNSARAALERAEKKDPDNLAVLSSLAEACTQARDYAAAKRYHQTLLDRGHNEAPYHLGLGKALVGLGEHEAAIGPLSRAIEMNPKLSEVRFHLARAYRAVGRAEDAQRELRIFSALKENPFAPFEDRPELEQTVWRRVEALVKDGKEQDATQLLNSAGRPEDTQSASFLIGALYYSQGRLRDAQRLLADAVKMAPNTPKARTYLGLTYIETGRLAEAERVLTEEMDLRPKEPLVLMAFGKLQFGKQNWREAARFLQESRVVEPRVRLMLCEAQLQLGQRAQAQETAQLIAAMSTADAAVRPALDRLLARFSLPLEGDVTPAK